MTRESDEVRQAVYAAATGIAGAAKAFFAKLTKIMEASKDRLDAKLEKLYSERNNKTLNEQPSNDKPRKNMP